MTRDTERRLCVLQRAALDDAYKAHLILLWSSWMKDDTGQPGRARAGAKKALDAYLVVSAEIDEHEKQLED